MKNSEIQRRLIKKGWKVKEKTNHIFLEFYYDGKPTGIKTFISRGTKEYSKSLLSQIKKQIKLNTEEELRNYLRCQLSNEEYLKILTAKGIL